MALVKTPEKNDSALEEKGDDTKELYRVTPRYDAWLNKDTFQLEVALPGVAKENLEMKALEDYFKLRAVRDNVEYRLDLDLSFRIEPDKVKTTYSEGLLHIEFKRYKPLEHAHVLLSREQKESDKGQLYRTTPRHYRHVDYGARSVQLDFALPGVAKENIDLRVLPTWLHLSAIRPEGNVEFAANVSFGVEVVPEKCEVEYYNGLLKVKAHLRDPLDDAKEVPL